MFFRRNVGADIFEVFDNVDLLASYHKLATKWNIYLASFAPSFERLSQDKLFQFQVLMHLAATELGSSHFR